MSKIVWTTRDGQKLALHEIGDTHLLNIINMLQRKLNDMLSDGYGALSYLQGEAAIDAVESSMSEQEQTYHGRIYLFQLEAERRGLLHDG